MKEQGQPKPPVRRIIERTRLLKQLEEANARTILLIAPAGYGKTTLARQWLERHEGRELSLRLAESDVAVLARALARGLAWKVPALTRSVEEAIRAAPTPTQQARSVLQSDPRRDRGAARHLARHRRLPRARRGLPRADPRRHARSQRPRTFPDRVANKAVVGVGAPAALRRPRRDRARPTSRSTTAKPASSSATARTRSGFSRTREAGRRSWPSPRWRTKARRPAPTYPTLYEFFAQEIYSRAPEHVAAIAPAPCALAAAES